MAWTHSVGKQHGIIVVIVCSDTTNGMRGRKYRLIMGCEIGGNYKKKDVIVTSYTMKVKYPIMLISVPSGSGWKVTVKCEFHNHVIVKNIEDDGALGRLKDSERKFVNYMTKYNMAL